MQEGYQTRARACSLAPTLQGRPLPRGVCCFRGILRVFRPLTAITPHSAEQQRIVIEARNAAQKGESKSTEGDNASEPAQQQLQPEVEEDQLTEDENDIDNAPEALDYSIPKWYPVLEVKIAALRFEIQKDSLAEPLADLKVTCRTCRKPMPMDHTWRTHCAVVHGRTK